MAQKTQLNLSIILPQMDAKDECVRLLIEKLSQQKGIEKAHLVEEDGQAKLCLHYDPNLVTLNTVERLARDSGAAISEQYRHEQIPFTRLHTADAALGLERNLRKLKGMIHASVNYAAGVIFVAYDTTILKPETIDAAIRSMGASVVQPTAKQTLAHDHDETESEEEQEHDHDHGGAPRFLPHWVQERWTFILVGLAGIFPDRLAGAARVGLFACCRQYFLCACLYRWRL